jgi:hypothetical protein
LINAVKSRTDRAVSQRYLCAIAFMTPQAGNYSMRKQKIRNETDRRMRDIGPPKKMPDRRQKAERRLPELTEMPYEEFEAELAALGKQASAFLRTFSSGR